MRVRGFTQDDGHIFCTEDQIFDECVAYTAQLQKVYADFGFGDNILYKIATRPAARIGSDAVWDKAERALFESLRASGCEFEIAAGEGAFYGPKIEYTLKDALGRPWQTSKRESPATSPTRCRPTPLIHGARTKRVFGFPRPWSPLKGSDHRYFC